MHRTLLLLLTLFAPAALAAEPKPGKMTVAVLEFVNASSEPGLESLGKGLQSMVTTDLTRVGALTLVERSRLQDLLAEQKLSQSGLIDKNTAAKIGKLVGATHLLGGTYTVVGGSMRLDARLFAVKSGEVLLAEEITGDRDAFFELEKSLVNRLVGALGVKLDPKERANVARIHTADFAAFQAFSQGVAAFDQQKYDEAMDRLRDAMRVDSEFNLARVTLDEYEQLVAKIRSRAQNIELSQRELAKQKEDLDFARDSAIAARLLAIADEPGPRNALRRLAALHYLIGLYNPKNRNHGRISRYQDHFDTLIVRRRVDGLARRYLAEAQAVYPDAPLFSTGSHPPDTLDLVEKRLDGLVAAFKNGLELRPEHKNDGLINNLRSVDTVASLMAVDHHERIKLYELALSQLTKLKADPYIITRLLMALSEVYLQIGDLEHASGALARASAIETSASTLKDLAGRVEAIGEVSKVLAKTALKSELRELIARQGRLPSKATLARFEQPVPTPALMRELARAREPARWYSHADPFWMWSGEPAYLIQGENLITTGPRTDGLNSRDLRYYRPKADGRDALIARGRGTRSAFTATFELAFSPDRTFWPLLSERAPTVGDLQLNPGRPEVTFVFGLHSIATQSQQDPETRKSFFPEPTQGYGIRFADDQIALVRLGEDAPSAELIKSTMTVKLLASEKRKLGDKTKVTITVKDRTVTVSAGGSYSFTLPTEANGFIGAHFRGIGFAAIDDLTVR